jgi:hypothetical protein
MSSKKLTKTNKKGLIFTLDAVFALVTALTLIMAAFYLISQDNQLFNEQALELIAQDSLTVLEKDGTLAAAVESSSNITINLYQENLPEQVCSLITIKNSAGQQVMNTLSSSCSTNAKEYSVARRSFVSDQDPYYAEMTIWYKGGTS